MAPLKYIILAIAMIMCLKPVLAKSSEDLIREKLSRIYLDHFQKQINMYIGPPSVDFKDLNEKIDYMKPEYWYVFGKGNSITKYIPNELNQFQVFPCRFQRTSHMDDKRKEAQETNHFTILDELNQKKWLRPMCTQRRQFVMHWLFATHPSKHTD